VESESVDGEARRAGELKKERSGSAVRSSVQESKQLIAELKSLLDRASGSNQRDGGSEESVE